MKAITAMLLVVILGILSLNYLGKIEGYYNPVISEATILITRDYNTRSSAVFINYHKDRECSYLDSTFDLLVDGKMLRLNAHIENEAFYTFPGPHSAGPWFINSPLEEGVLRVRLTHLCHVFWPTETILRIPIENG